MRLHAHRRFGKDHHTPLLGLMDPGCIGGTTINSSIGGNAETLTHGDRPVRKKKSSGRGSFCVGNAIQGREHPLLWPRTGNRTKGAKKDSASDAQLLEHLKQRDEHGFLNLYDRYGRPVYRFLMHMTGSVAVAEDLTQEVFLVILDAMCSGAIKQFDPERGTLEGYLLGIARNLVRAERRRTYRLLPLEGLLETPEWNRLLDKLCLENQKPDAEGLLAMQSELKFLYRAILELPHQYRETIVLCSLQERSYQEVAAILQCSEGTIASRMNRAKALLSAKLRGSTANAAKASAT
jgi:RNA polymerase sigma-70 factor (ECF subfamily)